MKWYAMVSVSQHHRQQHPKRQNNNKKAKGVPATRSSLSCATQTPHTHKLHSAPVGWILVFFFFFE
jgi:hypothetical protein